MDDISSYIKASSIAGVIARAITHPLDTIRVRWQAGSHYFLLQNGTFIQSFQSLYRGCSIAIAMTVPSFALYFVTYEKMKQWIETNWRLDQRHSSFTAFTLSYIMSVSAAEIVSGITWTPMEVIKQRLQTDSTKQSLHFKEYILSFLLTNIKSLYCQNGIRSFYTGYFVSLSMFIPNSAIYFTCFENLKAHAANAHDDHHHHHHHQMDHKLSLMMLLNYSMVSSLVASVLTSPIDWIKTRWQLNPKLAAEAEPGIARLYLLMKFSVNIFSTYGFKGLLQNALARIMCVTPSASLSVAIFEYLKRYV